MQYRNPASCNRIFCYRLQPTCFLETLLLFILNMSGLEHWSTSVTPRSSSDIGGIVTQSAVFDVYFDRTLRRHIPPVLRRSRAQHGFGDGEGRCLPPHQPTHRNTPHRRDAPPLSLGNAAARPNIAAGPAVALSPSLSPSPLWAAHVPRSRPASLRAQSHHCGVCPPRTSVRGSLDTP